MHSPTIPMSLGPDGLHTPLLFSSLPHPQSSSQAVSSTSLLACSAQAPFNLASAANSHVCREASQASPGQGSHREQHAVKALTWPLVLPSLLSLDQPST